MLGAAVKGEGMQVLVGTLGICAAGVAVSMAWFAHIADRKPRTFTPQWKAATAKYRAAQNQDPISEGR
ncbi:hypothetical protein AB1Y20_011342 [Prymnesium parvum]|uniref:Transmembrane protein 242 n=1 Tax=Prymnesium parvum TaxID=97485 RepID=A0AB34IQ85_PRYPA